MFSFEGKKRKNAFFFEKFLSLTKFPTSSLCACEQLCAPHWKTLKKLTILKKQNFYDFLKNRNFQKLTTDFEIVQSVKLRPKHASFWMLTTRPYPTKQVQSILKPEISTHFAHFRFECKILKFQ